MENKKKQIKQVETRTQRENPVVFPMGFSIRTISSELAILEFIDEELPQNKKVLGSFILPKTFINNLVDRLQKTQENMSKKKDE